jgi:hypothetical protein
MSTGGAEMNTAIKPCCPTCGQAVQHAPRLDELCVALGLTGNVKRLFNILAAARGRYLSTDEIGEIIWMDREDGGPDDVNKSVHVHILRLRALLAGREVALDLLNGKSPQARLVWRVNSFGKLGYQLEKVAA